MAVPRGDLPGRNHYDRLAHLAFGFLLVVPLAEWALRGSRLSVGPARALAVVLLLALGSFYEVFEWLLAVIASPHNAERYNGQQRDTWDAQKDMAPALAGSLPGLLLVRDLNAGR